MGMTRVVMAWFRPHLDGIVRARSRPLTGSEDRRAPAAAELAGIVVRQSEQLCQAVSLLEKHDRVLQICVEINRLENEADRIASNALARLFDTEKDPISLIKQKELYEVLETATDKAEDAANVIESVVVKSA